MPGEAWSKSIEGKLVAVELVSSKEVEACRAATVTATILPTTKRVVRATSFRLAIEAAVDPLHLDGVVEGAAGVVLGAIRDLDPHQEGVADPRRPAVEVRGGALAAFRVLGVGRLHHGVGATIETEEETITTTDEDLLVAMAEVPPTATIEEDTTIETMDPEEDPEADLHHTVIHTMTVMVHQVVVGTMVHHVVDPRLPTIVEVEGVIGIAETKGFQEFPFLCETLDPRLQTMILV